MKRFSRDKRDPAPFSYEEFMDTVEPFIDIVKRSHPELQVEVLICEALHKEPSYGSPSPLRSPRRSTHTKSYRLEQLTIPVWQDALRIQVMIHDPNPFQPYFGINLILNKLDEPRSLKFLIECEEALMEEIGRQFAQPTPYFTIGDGHPVLTAFNQRLGPPMTVDALLPPR